MKTILLFLILTCSYFSFAQSTDGFVEYEIIEIDTINNVSFNLSDSVGMLYNYGFSPNSTRTDIGTISSYTSTINNANGYYILRNTDASREYFFYPDNEVLNIDTLLNYEDSSDVQCIITSEHKVIKGFYCTKALWQSLNENGEIIVNYIWYTDQIKGNNIIPNGGVLTNHLNGLILEYEYITEMGKRVITAKNVVLASNSNDLFFPDLTNYTLMNPQ